MVYICTSCSVIFLKLKTHVPQIDFQNALQAFDMLEELCVIYFVAVYDVMYSVFRNKTAHFSLGVFVKILNFV